MSPTKALVVEDDAGLLGLYSEVLQEEGYDVDGVQTGREATERLSACRYGVLLCDMVLPDSSGLEVINAARREGQDLPIVLITGHPTLQTAIAAVEKGVSRYLEKPVSREGLVASVEAAVRAHQQGALEGAARARVAAARRALEGAFEAALGSIQTACEPVQRLGDGAVVAYCAVTPDRSCGLPYSLSLVRAARHLGRMDELSLAARRSASAVRRTAAQGLPLLVPTPLEDVDSGRLLEGSDPLVPLAHEIVLDIWPAIPREGGKRLVARLDALRRAGYRLALPVPPLGESSLAVRELGSVDYLRLDPDMVSGLEGDPLRRVLVEDAVARSSEAEAEVLASGCVSPHGEDVLKGLGCGLLQVNHREACGQAPLARARARESSGLLGWWQRLTSPLTGRVAYR